MENEVKTICDPDWNKKIDRLTNAIAYDQPIDRWEFTPDEIVAAKVYMKWVEKEILGSLVSVNRK